MINATNNPYPESPDPSPSKLDKGGYEGNAETLDTKIDAILAEAKVLIDNTLVGSSSVGSIVPSSVPPATGAVHAFATQAGTYTNWGGFVVPANTFAFISRSVDLVFSISPTALDVTGKVNVTDVFNLVEPSSFIDGSYYNNLGVKLYNSGTKYTHFIDLLDIKNLTIFSEVYGSAASVLFAADKTTFVAGFINATSNIEIDLSAYPTARYLVMSNGKTSTNYKAIGIKNYNLNRIDILSKSNSAIIGVDSTAFNLKIVNAVKSYSNSINEPFDIGVTASTVYKKFILNIELYNASLAKDYCIAVIRKNTGGVWQIRIYEWVSNTFGELVCEFNRTAYVPVSNVERVALTTVSGSVYGYATVKWSELVGDVNLTSIPYTQSGLSKNILKVGDASLPSDSDSSSFSFITPSVIYLQSNASLWMYDDCLIENESKFNPSKFSLFASSNLGHLERYEDFTKINATANHTVTLKIRDNKSLTPSNKSILNVLTKTITVNSKAKATAKNINTLVIADSYFDNQYGSGIYEYITAFATADSNTVTYKGTRTSHGNLGEARASWTENLFLTKYVPLASRVAVNGDSTSANMCSPFVFSTDDTVTNKYFSFSQYLSSNSITGVDNIVLFLGMNGGTGVDTNTMIANIKIALPSVKIFVCMVPPAESWRLNRDSDSIQLGRETQNKSYLSLFDNRQAENIYIVPITLAFSREYALNYTKINTVQFPTEIVDSTLKIMPNDHHPNALGAKSIAYLVYNYLAYFS